MIINGLFRVDKAEIKRVLYTPFAKEEDCGYVS
jgi:hypothetical protein